MSKSLVFIDDFSKEEIYEIFRLADRFTDGVSRVKPLEGKTVVVRHSNIEVVKSMAKNVVTHGEYRKKRYATACLNFAKEIAKESNCYKMMLLTGSKEESTLKFYRNAGYNSADKTAFIQWIDM